ncbi:Type 1 glutamine amidotransferase-like domain-containing protein [Pseudalkalibacillus berkeleyi]|uniref:Type 1 glutamine amidotransferase-like domain-containing protein n=1 Tax=Pseudalkalibacillus berkeleyi TaxID=1069813 RepID=A0ABS9H6A8_9BACL|nr:Type 1 glutamine amidotransferase-like domain-containing protein [Pseudalkalibacillus berkeleyi]MCF6139402.1 Type 1 glutamine amidotransferase-like domain-containing protein [Pseudalkalibacillus berkeleyi]
MSQLIMLSSLDASIDQHLADHMKRMISKKGTKLGYVPSQYDETKYYFNKMRPHLERLGFEEFIYVDIDQAFEQKYVKSLETCDAIFLSGGNTYYFLNNLKNRGLISVLQRFVQNGGLLIGVSAGAMMMSHTIEIAANLDPNDIALKDLDALNFIPFHFLPHYDEEKHDIRKIVSELGAPVYTCKDGAGIILSHDTKLTTYGEIEKW